MKKILTREIPEDVSLEVKGLHPLLRRLYLARGIRSAEELNLDLENLLPYNSLSGIQDAVETLYEALLQQKSVLIVGDFDADGATSTALAVKALKSFGFQNVTYFIPSRFEHGYGLTEELVGYANSEGAELIITVDNGISSVAAVAKANEVGIGVVVTDHHLPGEELPAASAIVNPHQQGDLFPSKCLAGVGTIFYVMLALRRFLREKNWFKEQEMQEPNMALLLDLVAVGTVADVVPLDRNNRILVKQGLSRIRAGKCSLGVKALLKVARKDYQQVAAVDLAYWLAPRLNAAGRLQDMGLGVECLLADVEEKALSIAEQLNQLNVERRVIESGMKEQVANELADLSAMNKLPKGLCLFNEGWHQGVVGLVASRVKEEFYRPVIAFARVSEAEIKGSARSIPEINIRELLELVFCQHPGVVTKFGGHALAAGLTVAADKYQEFCRAFNLAVEKHIGDQLLERRIYTDGELRNNEFSLGVAELLLDAGPWGQGFPEPTFQGVFDIVDQKLVANKHLKLSLGVPGTRRIIDAIAFNVDLRLWPNYRVGSLDMVYRLVVNEYNGSKRIQLIVDYME